MRKILTLAAAVLASACMFAADYDPAATAVYTVGDTSTFGSQWKTGLNQNANYFVVADTVIFSPYVLYQSAATGYQEWTGHVGGGGSTVSWDAIANRCFKGSDAMFSVGAKRANVRSSRVYKYNVTNCIQVMALVKSSNSITLSVNAYEIENNVISSTLAGTATYKSDNTGIVSLDGLDKDKSYRIEILTDDSGSNSSFYEIAFVHPHPCQDPVFTVSEGGVGFVGDPIDIAVTSKNHSKPINSAVTVDGVPGVYATDYTFSASTGLVQATPLRPGRFVITFTQASNGEYCDAVDSAIYVISEKAGVAAVTIEGPTAGYKGNEVTYTATAESATEYRWKVNGAIQAGADSAKFIYTPAAIGAYSIVCEARNEYNDQDAWIASDPIALTVTSLYGEIIKAELTSGTAATVTGKVGGTADVSLSSNKKLDKNRYFGIALAYGKFQQGDTVVITMTTKGSNYPCLFADKERTNCLFLATETSNALEYKIVLPAAADTVSTLYVSRGDESDGYKWNPVLSSMAVIRPVPVKSTVETLTAVTVNDVAISAANLAELLSAKTLILEDSYVNAPVVKFTKHVVVTYEDDSTKESDEVIEKTASQATASTWGASATIGGNAYAVYTVKQFSYVVTYKLGEQTLGSENVSANGSPAEYAQYETMPLASFDGWYSDADLAEGHKVENIAAEVITEAKTFYAKFTYLYAESVNIEQLVLDNGVGYDLMALMGTKHYASNWTNDLDSLNDEKTARNYAFLGQKVKAAGKMLDLRLPANGVLRVKFGNVGATPQVSINKGEYADMQIVEGVYTYEASVSAYISIKTVSSSTVVFKQIMINEAIADVTLPSSGTATAIENAAVEAKATKRMVNGQVLIVRDGKTYNALGAEVK